jgi:CRISPR-associated protein Csd1
MILQALEGYYTRLKSDPDKGIPDFGFSREKIDFEILLDKEGNVVGVSDLREVKGNKKNPKAMIVPQGVKKSVNIAPSFLWDNTGYVFGVDAKGNPKRAAEQFEEFKKLHHGIGDALDDEGMRAVLRFLDRWRSSMAPTLKYWDEMCGKNIVFRLDGERKYIHERPSVREAWRDHIEKQESGFVSYCLIKGERLPIARLHNSIRGVKGAQPTGASIVSFNLAAFCSFGKDQGYNAPVSVGAVFEYTTALNFLLRFESNQKVQIGDATTVFWAERDSPVEGFLGTVFDPREASEEESRTVKLYLEAVREGKKPKDIDSSVRFYLLGLSPNASRIAVRFWYSSTVGDIGEKIGQHFRDIAMEKQYENEREFPGIQQLLRETAQQRKFDNIPPKLSGDLMRSILTGSDYTQSLLSAVITRIRADHEINYLRAAILKGCLVRKSRKQQKTTEVSMSLSKENRNIAYLLGRLFAILERAQQGAVPGAKATIKDRYYGSASATPRPVFPLLLRLAQHHIQKAEYGTFYDKQIEEVMQDIQEFPGHLSLDDQGLFAIGYYHQRNALFRKSDPLNQAKE